MTSDLKPASRAVTSTSSTESSCSARSPRSAGSAASRRTCSTRASSTPVSPGEPPILAIAIVEVRYGLQTHDLYHLRSASARGGRLDGVGDRRDRGLVVYDAIADPSSLAPDRRA